ncbi:MAG: phytanoyl-CoA dioxygenase family protein [Mariniblastus sp.]|nr:phytanoyl-CoA dioxygenase family protein [Mariniblastus sp.]
MISRIAVSQRENSSGVLDCQQSEKADRLFRERGALWIENVFSPSMVSRLRRAYQQRYIDQGASELARRHAVVGNRRFMATVELEPPFNSPKLFANPFLTPLFESWLGPGYLISSFGSVVAFPGAAAQDIHFDFPPLFDSEKVCCQLPPYAITLVIPLVDLDAEIGSTAWWEGSHSDERARQKLQELTRGAEMDDTTFPAARAGDVYLMDYRLIHGGMANRSEQVRPILYIVYARPWFRDAYNFSDQVAVDISPQRRRALPRKHRHLFPASPGRIR